MPNIDRGGTLEPATVQAVQVYDALCGWLRHRLVAVLQLEASGVSYG